MSGLRIALGAAGFVGRSARIVLCSLGLALAAHAPGAAQAAPLAGTWEGTSVCLANRGVCHDEHVVYHVARAAPAPGDSADYTIDANKVVNGREEEMGVLRCRAGRGGATLACPMPPRFRPGTWSFIRRGNVLDGGLTTPDGTRVRRVSVRRRG
ncbi:MAG TPA: hypothetical protein VF771_18970 [Longimicrobiaceae bacterium]